MMREFYSSDIASPATPCPTGHGGLAVPTRARVAVYDSPAAAPRVIDIDPAPVTEYLENLSSSVYRCSQEQGGDVPYSVIREVSENFIHAGFAEPVVSVLENGCTLRFADQGPGFPDEERAFVPGFTTATSAMKRYIRGVGSGLPLVREYLNHSGGRITVEDNLGRGTVITLRSGSSPTDHHAGLSRSATADPSRPHLDAAGHEAVPVAESEDHTRSLAPPMLSTRQKQVLALVMESGSVGPSIVSRELRVGISTAYRDLAALEEHGLICADGGKRTLTRAGMSYLDGLMSRL